MNQPETGSFELIKSLNTACILNAIRINGQISRAEMARQTGLTPATVSNLTSELMDIGLIEETERGESSGGRKPVMLSINRTACYFGGVHIGSEMVEAAISDVAANVLLSKTAPLKKYITPEETVKLAVELLKEAREQTGISRLAGIGICTHGLVKSNEGISVFAPNLGWSDVPIGRMFADATGLPVILENDVRAMALAESWCGCARGKKDYVYLFIGPGIGGSIVSNNELYKGPGGFAGELGHNTIEPDGPKCSCGNYGCLQALASETAILERYCAKKGIRPEQFKSAGFACVLDEAKTGDKLAMEEILTAVRYIGIEVGNIINALSPSLIVINGRITGLENIVRPALAEEVFRRRMRYSKEQTEIIFSALGDQAPIRGAATCIIRQMFEAPRIYL